MALLAAAPLAAQAPTAWVAVIAEAHRSGTFHNDALTESSGVVASRRHPGVLWTLNDSGNPPWLFATDTLGHDLGTVRVSGARNRDWEAIAVAPSGVEDCLYLADTGDNYERYASATIYRIREPAPPGRRPSSSTRAQSLTVRYPGGAHDVEALLVDRRADMYLITKGLWSDVRLFRVRAAAWDTGSAIAEDLGPLPIEHGRELGRLVTDAALSPDGRAVAVRTYQEIYLFEWSDDGRLRPAAGSLRCSVAGLDAQGEGIAWLDRRTLVLTSEGALGTTGTVSVARCPEPAAHLFRTD